MHEREPSRHAAAAFRAGQPLQNRCRRSSLSVRRPEPVRYRVPVLAQLRPGQPTAFSTLSVWSEATRADTSRSRHIGRSTDCRKHRDSKLVILFRRFSDDPMRGRVFKFQNGPINRTSSKDSVMRPILKFERPIPQQPAYRFSSGELTQSNPNCNFGQKMDFLMCENS